MNAQQVNAQFEIFFANLKARNAAQFSKDNDITLSYAFKHDKSIKSGMVKIKHELFAKYSNDVLNHDSSACDKNAFIAVKANYKIARILDGIGCGSINGLDEYTVTIVANALHNGGKILSKSALVCLSDNITYNELDATDVLKNRMRKAATTASTQRSSTREALRILDLAIIHKGAKGDDIELTIKGKELFEAIF